MGRRGNPLWLPSLWFPPKMGEAQGPAPTVGAQCENAPIGGGRSTL